MKRKIGKGRSWATLYGTGKAEATRFRTKKHPFRKVGIKTCIRDVIALSKIVLRQDCLDP